MPLFLISCFSDQQKNYNMNHEKDDKTPIYNGEEDRPDSLPESFEDIVSDFSNKNSFPKIIPIDKNKESTSDNISD